MAKRFQQPAMANLIAFEAAARTGSFTRAAEELSISQPAISHAMRELESELGVALFQRRHKGVETTDAGRHLYEQASLGLTLIDQALGEVRAMTPGPQVTLAVSTATATWWLLPRIARFKQQHPDIELRCITTDTDLDLGRERIDLAITLGTGEFPQHQRWHFVDEEIFPVCSPAYLKEHGAIADVQALTRPVCCTWKNATARAWAGRAGWRVLAWRWDAIPGCFASTTIRSCCRLPSKGRGLPWVGATWPIR